MKKCILLSFLLIFVFPKLYAQEPLADRMEERFKSEEFSVGILLQTLGQFSFTDNKFNGGNKFDIGATRLVFRGTVDNNFIYKLQTDFRKQPSILDAQVGYAFSENFRLIAGAFKPFLSIDLDPSPAATDFIDRARHVGAMMNSREIGITFLGEPGNFNYRVGMYNGTGLSRDNDGGFMYTARLGYAVQNESNSFQFGFNGALNQTELERVGNTGLYSLGDRKLYGAFVQYHHEFVFGTVELIQTRFDAEAFDTEETITGFFATVGSSLSEKSDLLVRWDHLEFDVLNDASELVIFGWNHQATQLVGFQLNLLALMNDTEDNQLGMSANFQFHF